MKIDAKLQKQQHISIVFDEIIWLNKFNGTKFSYGFLTITWIILTFVHFNSYFL